MCGCGCGRQPGGPPLVAPRMAGSAGSSSTAWVDTSTVSPSEQFDLWRCLIASELEPLEADGHGEGGFRGRLRTTELGDVKVCEVASEGHIVRRTPRLIAQDAADVLKLEIQLSGTTRVAQAGRRSELAPGDFLLCDTRRPYAVDVPGNFRMLVLMIPREALALPARGLEDLTAVRLTERPGSGEALRPLLADLARSLDDADRARSTRLASSTIALLTGALMDRLDLRPREPEDVRRIAWARVADHIERNLSDPDLSPEAVARAAFVSKRYLHKLFAAKGLTVSAWIRDRRLDRARADLVDPQQACRAIGAIAAEVGLTDAAHFSRMFKAAVGVTPREYRILGGILDGGLPEDGAMIPDLSDYRALRS